MAGAVIWLAYELIILIGPKEFRDAQYYVLGALGLGLVFYMVQMVTEREAMRTEPGQELIGVNVLAIDQGTSATKALLVGPGAEVLGRGEVPVRTRSVGADGVEADPEELFESVLAAGRRALAGHAARPRTRSRWPTRARPCWPGTAAPAGRCPPRSSGRTAGRGASARGSPTARPNWPRSPACRSTRTSPRRR